MATQRSFEKVSFYAVSYASLTVGSRDPVTDASNTLASWIDANSNYHNIRIVAHSLGGVVARAAVVRAINSKRVSAIISLGSPLAGSAVSVGAVKIFGLPADALQTIHPGSPFLRDLSGRWRRHQALTATEHHCMASKHDILVTISSALYLCTADSELVIENLEHTELPNITSREDGRYLWLLRYLTR